MFVVSIGFFIYTQCAILSLIEGGTAWIWSRKQFWRSVFWNWTGYWGTSASSTGYAVQKVCNHSDEQCVVWGSLLGVNLCACLVFSRAVSWQYISLLCRKRILQGLMCGHPSDATGGSVDELQEVEMKIEGLRQEIQHIDSRQGWVRMIDKRQVLIYIQHNLTKVQKNWLYM